MEQVKEWQVFAVYIYIMSIAWFTELVADCDKLVIAIIIIILLDC